MSDHKRDNDLPIAPLSDEDAYRRLLFIYNVFRDYTKVEHELQNQRSTWHLVIQGFLFATLGVMGQWGEARGFPNFLNTERNSLPYVLATAGVLIAIFSQISIWAADTAIQELIHKWGRITKDGTYKRLADDYFPGIAGGGSEKAERRGKFSMFAIPIIIMGAWSAVAIIFSLDLKSVGQTPQKPAANPVHLCQVKIPEGQLTDSDIVAEIACAEFTQLSLQQKLKVPVVSLTNPKPPKPQTHRNTK